MAAHVTPIDFVAIDFETANERRDSACAVAIAIVRGGEIETRSWLLRPPDMRFSPFNIRVHGITPAMVQRAPTWGEAWPEIAPVLAAAPELWAHNAPFDAGVLRAVCAMHGLVAPWPLRCTVQLARRHWPGLHCHKLDVVCAHLGIGLRHHDAVSDARACARIVLAARGLPAW